MATSVLPHGAPTRRYRRVPWSPRAWSQALYLTGGIPAQLVPLLLVVLSSLARPRGLWPLLLLVVVFLAVPLLTGIQRHRLRATAGVLIPAQPVIPDRLSRAGDRRGGPRAGHLAPARLPPASCPGAGGGRHRRLRDVAGGRPLRAGLRLRLDAARGEPAPARPVGAATRAPPALLRHPDGRLPDRRRDRAAGGRAVAHRRGRGAGRQGRPGAAGPEPRRGAGIPGGTPGPDPGRRGRRRRRRAAPPGAGPARRHPAAAGLARDAAGHGPRRTP